MRVRPWDIAPLDSAGDPVGDGPYTLDVVDGEVVGLVPDDTGAGGGSISYAQTSVTATIARNTSSGGTWNYLHWTVSHHMYFRIISFACDILQTDTYTLSIDGEDVGSAASTGGGAPFSLSITLGTPKVLEKGTHTFRLRGTAARNYYFQNGNAPIPTGTYPTKVTISPWLGPSVVASVHGTLTFDAEGS